MTLAKAKEIDAALSALSAALHSERLTINALDDGSGVVLDVEKEQLMTLNPSAMVLMEAIHAGARSEPSLVTALTRQFEIDPERAEQDTRTFLSSIARVL